MEISSKRSKALLPRMSTSDHALNVSGFDGLRFSSCHYAEGPVGITYIDFGNAGAACHTDVRGGSTSTLHSACPHTKERCDGICIVGGTYLGMEATAGIMEEQWADRGQSRGINAAEIWSHNLEENWVHPDKALGAFAYRNMSTTVYSGQVGAGTTAAKGQGCAYAQLSDEYGNARVLCIVVNNAMGAIYGLDGKRVKPPKTKVRDGQQTTITVVITDLQLDPSELRQMSHQLHCSMAVSIRPFNTMMDGDIFYACSTNTRPKPATVQESFMLTELFCEFTDVLQDAILMSIKK